MSQKLENLLNLALDADQGERERSEELDLSLIHISEPTRH